MHEFSFGSVSSADYGAYVLDVKVREHTRRDMEFISVNGRSGDLLIDNGRYSNIDVIVTCAITRDAVEKMLAMNARLLAEVDYNRLSSTFDPEHYWVGAYSGGITPRITYRGDIAVTELPFNCKPQRYLKGGDLPAVTVNGTDMGVQVVGVGDEILNAAAKGTIEYFASVEGFNVTTGDVFTVADTSGYADDDYNRSIRFYFESDHPEAVYYIYSEAGSSVLDGGSLAMAYEGTRQINTENYIKFPLTRSSSLFTEFAIQGRCWWAIYDDDTDEVIWSITPDNGTLTIPAGVMAYAPLIHISVSGAVDGTVASVGGDTIILNTPATIGDPRNPSSLTDVYIDCETFNSYTIIDGAVYNLNKYVSLQGRFLYSQTMKVYINSLIESIEVIPRWWTL